MDVVTDTLRENKKRKSWKIPEPWQKAEKVVERDDGDNSCS